MGMNYELDVTPPHVKQEILLAIQNNQFQKARRLLNSYTPIHIGKSSGGWQFIFNHHNWQYFNSLETLKEWLKSGTIIDEYGEECTFEDFWNKVESKKDGLSSGNEHFGCCFSFSVDFS